jgi:hypothetical protein
VVKWKAPSRRVPGAFVRGSETPIIAAIALKEPKGTVAQHIPSCRCQSLWTAVERGLGLLRQTDPIAEIRQSAEIHLAGH